MKPKIPILAVLLATTVSWTIISSAVGDAGEPGSQESRAVASGIRAWRTFSSTVNGGTTYRVSGRGNVYSVESPTGIDHIDSGDPTEGYCLRYAPEGLPSVEAYDIASSQSGFNSATRSSSAPWKVLRTTSDGSLKLTQEFTFDGLEKALQVKMTVRNVSKVPVSNILVFRTVDFDVDVGGLSGFANAADNWVAITDDSVLAWSDAAMYLDPHGMLLEVLLHPSNSSAEGHFDNDATTCVAGLFKQGPHKGDDQEGFLVGFGSLNPGAKRSVTIRYARF